MLLLLKMEEVTSSLGKQLARWSAMGLSFPAAAAFPKPPFSGYAPNPLDKLALA